MALPSSAPRNKVGAALSGPGINLAAYTPNPAAITDAMSQGVNLGNQLSDTILLRPKQVQAARAAADASNQVSQTTGAQAQAQRDLIPLQKDSAQTLIPLRTKEEATKLGAQTTGNETEQILAAVKKGVAEDPAFAELMKKHLMNAQGTAAASSGRELTLAKSAEKNAPVEADTNAAKTQTANVQANVENAAVNQDDTKDAMFNTLVDNAKTAAGQAGLAAAPFTDSLVKDSLTEGAKAAAVNQGLTQKIGLANTITNGMGGGQLTPEAKQKVMEEAAKRGVPLTDASGMARPFADVSREYAQKVNVENAGKVLEDVRTEATNAANKLQTYQAIQQILPSVSTGGLRALPGAELIDSVAAGWGNRTAQANQQLSSFQNSLVLDATGGKLGNQISDGDVAILKSSYPGTKQSAQVNQNLTTAGLLVNQRGVQKGDFYNELVPAMGAAGADKLWRQYLATNPVFAPNSGPGNLQLNRSALTPTEYLQAVKNPEAAAQKLSQQVDPSTLPILNPRNPANTPFVTDGKGQVIPNPVYWTPIQTAHQQSFTAPPAAASAGPRIQSIVTTPVSDLIRPRKN